MFSHTVLAFEGFGDNDKAEMGLFGLNVRHGGVMGMAMRIIVDFEFDGFESSIYLKAWSGVEVLGLMRWD